MALGPDQRLKGLFVAALLVPGTSDVEPVAGEALASGQGTGRIRRAARSAPAGSPSALRTLISYSATVVTLKGVTALASRVPVRAARSRA